MCDHHFPGKVCLPDPAFLEPDGTGVPVISLDANNGDVFVGGPAGGFGHRGRLVLTNAAGDKTYEIDGETGTASQSGDIVLLDADGNERVRISGQNAEVIIKSAAGNQIVHVDGRSGGITVGGDIHLGDTNTYPLAVDTNAGPVAFRDGMSGYIVQRFVNASGSDLRKGDVVTAIPVIVSKDGAAPVLEAKSCVRDADRNVIGVVAREAMPYPSEPDTRQTPEDPETIEVDGTMLVVTYGSFAQCKVETHTNPTTNGKIISPGDLLMTSGYTDAQGKKGYAKKAVDPKMGRILGKALTSLLEDRTGYVSVFVTLG